MAMPANVKQEQSQQGNIAPAVELKQGPTGKKFTLMPQHSNSSATKVQAKPDRSKPTRTVRGSTPLHPPMVFIILVKMINHQYSTSVTRTFATAPYSCFLYLTTVHPKPASGTQSLTFANHKPECIHFSELKTAELYLLQFQGWVSEIRDWLVCLCDVFTVFFCLPTFSLLRAPVPSITAQPHSS